jgi:hypothetical protein
LLEDKDLWCVSHRLDEGVGASAGFGSSGGGASVVEKRKQSAQDMIPAEIMDLKKTVAGKA